MVWFILALFSAFSRSLMDVFKKKSLKNIDEYMVSFSWRLFTLIFILPLLIFINFQIGENFWIALIAKIPLLIIATITYIKAIKYSDLSLAVPMIAFTPLFVVILSPFIIGEIPTLLGVIGIFLVVIGTYILKIKDKNKGLLYPFKALFKEKGPKFMFITAFLYAITSVIDKVGVQNSSPILWVFSFNALSAIGLLPIVFYKSKTSFNIIKKNFKFLLPIGFFSALSLVAHMVAINMTLVSYVISIKRTSILMSVVLGYFLFREKNIRERIIGVSVMILGVIVITLFS